MESWSNQGLRRDSVSETVLLGAKKGCMMNVRSLGPAGKMKKYE